jgi:hypothetical protein
MSDNINAGRSQGNIRLNLQHFWISCHNHPSIEDGLSGLNSQEAFCVNKNSAPVTMLLPLFMDVIQLLVA